MSMIGNLRLATADELASLRKNPDGITDLLYSDDGKPDRPHIKLDIDKAWHALHFLLTGTSWEGDPPLNFLVSGGEPVGDVDVGYGPARTFSPAELKEIVAALAPITSDTLRARFAPAEMTELEIYPTIWDRPLEEDDTIGYVLAHYESLKPYLAEGANRGLGLIVFLS